MNRRFQLPRSAKQRKRRAVVDTNVLIAGISGFREPYISGKNPSADLLYEWAEKESFLWLYSEEILDEYKKVLRRLHVRPHTIGAVINLIRERADAIEIRSVRSISPDPYDDVFCQCAEQGSADVLYTINLKHFPQDRLKTKVKLPE